MRKKIKSKNPKIYFKGRSYKGLGPEGITTLLHEYDWNDLNDMDIDSCWNIMYKRILHVVDSLCPVEKKKSVSNDKPIWLTNNLMLLMKEWDRCMPKKIC